MRSRVAGASPGRSASTYRWAATKRTSPRCKTFIILSRVLEHSRVHLFLLYNVSSQSNHRQVENRLLNVELFRSSGGRTWQGPGPGPLPSCPPGLQVAKLHPARLELLHRLLFLGHEGGWVQSPSGCGTPRTGRPGSPWPRSRTAPPPRRPAP